MAVIDVITVVDAVRILRDIGPNNFESTGRYQQLPNEGAGFLYMLVTWYDAWNEGESELDVFARQGDTIRWRMTTTSAGTNYQCFIKEVMLTGGAYNITPPQLKYETIEIPAIDTTDPNLDRLIIQKTEDIYWETTVKDPGEVVYHLNFTLCGLGGGGGGGGGDGQCHGGYTYDPFINKSKRSFR